MRDKARPLWTQRRLDKLKSAHRTAVWIGLQSGMAIAFALALTSSCGGRPDTTSTDQAETTSSSSSGTTTTTTSSSSSSSSSGSTISSNPPLSFTYTLDGTGGTTTTYTTPAFVTDSTLVVRVTGNGGGTITVPGENFSMNYYCVSFNVTVNSQTLSTGPLAVNGGNPYLCPNDHADLDFSGQLTPGHGSLKIQVSNPEYDYYCELYYSGEIEGSCSMYCPLHTVYQTQTVSGNLAVEVDGTSLPAASAIQSNPNPCEI